MWWLALILAAAMMALVLLEWLGVFGSPEALTIVHRVVLPSCQHRRRLAVEPVVRGMHSSQPVLGPALIAVCVVMAVAAAVIYRLTALGSPWTVPWSAIRAAAQLAAVSGALAAAITRLWSSVLVLVVMFVVASFTAARRSQASRGSAWLTLPLGFGLAAVVPILLLSRVVPLTGVALVPIVAIVLGNTMTAVAVAARLALDTLTQRAGEVEAALSLGMSERDSRMEIIGATPNNALLPNLDSTRTVGLVTLPGAFVGVLLSTGSAAQAGAVQILILIALLLSQTCGVAATVELIARGVITRGPRPRRSVWDRLSPRTR